MYEITNDQELSQFLRESLRYAEKIADPIKEEDDEEKIAVYSVTPNCYDFTIASIKSLLVNSSVDQICVLIDGIDNQFEAPDIVKFADVSNLNFLSPLCPNLDTKYTKMCLMRLAFADILPDYINRILSLDYDTIIDRNIDDIWKIDLGTKYLLAGVAERDRTIGYYRGYFNGDDFIKTSRFYTKIDYYVNAGVLLMNLKQIRAENTTRAFLEEINREKYQFPEQDVLNHICSGRIYELDERYNVSRFTYSPSEQKIVHFAGDEKNIEHPLIKKYQELSWDKIFEHRQMMYGK